LGGDKGFDVTMIRRRPIRLDRNASAAEWFALYVYEQGNRPTNVNELVSFAKNRGSLTYKDAAKVVALHADPSVPLSELPPPVLEQESIQGFERRPVCSPQQEDNGPRHLRVQSVFKSQPTQTQADAAHGVPGGANALCTVNYQEVGGFRVGEACAICLREEVGGNEVAVELLCQGLHRVHKACIEGWFESTAPSGKALSFAGDWAATWAASVDRREDCPVCRGDTRGHIAAKTSGVFKNRPVKTVADPAFGGQ